MSVRLRAAEEGFNVGQQAGTQEPLASGVYNAGPMIRQRQDEEPRAQEMMMQRRSQEGLYHKYNHGPDFGERQAYQAPWLDPQNVAGPRHIMYGNGYSHLPLYGDIHGRRGGLYQDPGVQPGAYQAETWAQML
ncbi:hypothetical protein SERLA73DRAFT_71407 [Serpula lacrymans var. lacrymans S7.3]|uniref:Uncharacterized protein n=2 Tax=Serpula lacrymans var. lacrymans TaxID=341189 RepID=F8PQL5_SERL3|nr:uncharacterized protein SERLADRAFT_435783 [Serpula lacrymans var. lacrymans S7.9]EGO02263.1 hypothetical protein SERLA73DRAFT_71407 [Serpula lacrymans var. lacrymans S7.3]EGO28007.1 hypothetical protein SERLADRAFT_435783 [Serpula lacrymans var. lacrymans S7.9]